MTDETLAFSFLGLTGYWYGLFVAVGIVFALRVFGGIAREKAFPVGTTPLFAIFALPLGLLISRLLFCLLDFRFHSVFSLKAIAMFWGGGFSMTGALLGAVLAAWLTARRQGVHPLALLDAATPALLLFMAAARMGEGFTELLGRSRPLTMPFLMNSFLAQNDGYDAYLRTYLLEAVTAGVLCVVLMIRRRRARLGDTLFTGMLLLGCCQVFWESLRFDSHMRYSFISMQQILFALMFAAALIVFASRVGKKAVIASVILCLALTGAIVGLEFLIDRSSISDLLLYILYALLLALPAALGLHYRKRSERQ